MGLEELPAVAYTVGRDDSIRVNLFGPGEATLETRAAGAVRLVQRTRYPFEGAIAIRVEPSRAAIFAIRIRIPEWAPNAAVRVNGKPEGEVERGFLLIERMWHSGDEIALDFPMAPVVHRQSNRSVQESRAPDGSPVAQEVMRSDYAAVTRGPLVYATGLVDGFKTEETLRFDSPRLDVIDAPPGFEGPAIRMSLGYREPLLFLPYFEAGGRVDGAWRLTWMPIAPDVPRPPAPRGRIR